MFEGRPEGTGAPAAGAEEVPAASVYLHGGQLHVAQGEVTVTTILGSCVSVCLFDPVASVGGINHYLLPHSGGREPSPRFGDVAMRMLLDQVLARGARRERLGAKVFGGAGMLDAFRRGQRPLGMENGLLALEFLREESVAVLQQDVGGSFGRKLVFRVGDGSAWVKRL